MTERASDSRRLLPGEGASSRGARAAGRMNRAKPTTVRRPSAAAKPSGHPPPGDFIALGSKGQASESKTTSTLLKPAPSGLPSERKRDASASLSGTSALTGLTKRPKLSSTPPLSALGRLAEAAVAEKRAISPSIKEPSVVPIEVLPTVLLDEIEAAELEGNDDRIEGVLCGAVKQLKVTRAKPDSTLYLSLMYLAKIKPNIFATEGVIEALCSLLRRDASVNFKAKGNSLVSVLACNLLMAAYEEDENWPEIFVKVYIEDSLGERIWVDSPHCRTFVDNIQTAFNTKMPPKSVLLQGEGARSGGELGAGSSPHPSLTEEEDSQTELLIAEEKLSPEQEGQLMPRYDELTESVEEYVLDMLRDQLNRRQPIDNVSRNLLRLLTATCGYKEVRLLAVQRLEMWLQNPKLTRPAQDLLMSVCMNCNSHGSEDMDVISHLIKIRLKPKVLLNHYMLCIRELLNAHKDNLGTTIKFVIFNELSNARNPNNMQILYTVLQHSSELAPKFLAMVFQDLLTNKDDYLRASRALLREIIKQTKHEINFQAFCLGLMQERKEPQYLEMEFKERFVVHITDVLAVSMMLGITAQVKEAGVAWDKGEKRNLEVLRTFQNQIAAIQRDAVWWLHTVVPSVSKLAPKDYVHCLHKVLFTEQPETYYKWDNWPPESDRNFFLRLCSEVPILEDTLMRVLVIGLSRELPLGPADAMELADHLVKRAAAVQADDVEVLKVERIQLIDAVLNLCTYHHPENIQLPPGYQPPNLAISTLYWKAWPLLLVVAAFNPENIGLAAWEEYPTLKMLMEMVMTNNYSYPPCTLTDEETRTEMINRELQISQREKQEILAFEGHLAAASTKQTITESSSLLLSQLTSLDPQGPPRRPPPHILDQVKALNQSLRLGHLLCRSRNPDFLLHIIQRQASSQSMPWLADLVQSSEGSLDVLPVQCLCEFLLHDAADSTASGEEDDEGESREQKAKKRQRQQKQRQLLGRLQDLLLGPKADEQTTCEVLDYFLRRLGSSQVASRVLAMKGLSLVLSEGGLRDKEEKEPPMEEDIGETDALQGYQWLLRDLPRLPLFDSVRTTTALALQQAIHMETDPQTISAYLIYLSQHTPVEEQGPHSDLALDVARLVVERSTIMAHLFSKPSCSTASDAVLSALLSVFSRYVRRMRKSKEGEEVYSWSESQDQVFLRWSSGETATMHILVVHAMVILLTLGPPRSGDSEFSELLDIWFPEKKPLPTAFLVDTSEEALLLPDWLKLRMIRSEVPRLVDAALQDLEPQQLLLFVQSFGIPVSSMSKLLQYLDQAVAQDPQTLEQNIMDKNYMAHLVEVQHERGASGGQTFHSLLTASLPPRRDSTEAPKPESSPEPPPGQGRTRAGTQVPVLGPEDDLAGIFLQIFPLSPDPRWQSSSPRPLALALQQALGQELARVRQGNPEVPGITVRLLQAMTTLLSSPHGGTLALAMHHSHFLSCPLMRQLYQYQRAVPQDTGFSSLFLKVLMQILQWLDSPAVEDGPLQAQLKLFATRYSARHRISDVRSGLLHLADALSFHGDLEVANSTARAVIATLRSGEKCPVEPELISKVLRGLIEVRSPHLEELLTALFSATTETSCPSPASGPIVVVSSLLLQEKEELLGPSKQEVEGASTEAMRLGPASGLLVDWLETLDPEVVCSCPDLQWKLLFSRRKGKGHISAQVLSFRPYLLALLTHQASWSTLHCCIRVLLGKSREQRLDPSASLDFLWACIHVPRIWQGRDQRTPQKRREELVLHVQGPELLSLVELILSEAETRSQDGDSAARTLIQTRLPLLLSCCRSNDESIGKVTEHLTSCIQQWGDSVLGQRCRDLLLQLYLQRPEVRVPVPEVLLQSEGATSSSICKLDGLVHRFITLLADTSDSRSSESRVADANMACRKLAVAHPVLLLRHLPMIAALLHGRTHLNFQEFRQQNHLAFFLHVLGILELLQPRVFQSEHQGALWDCLRSFIRLLLNYRKSSRHLAPFISKFVQFIHKYVGCSAPAAVAFLQKHAEPLHDLSFDNSDLVMLKSLLAGLSLPSRDGRTDQGLDEEGEDERSAGSLPLVSVSLSTPLTVADVAPHMKRLSRGRAVEDVLETLSDIDEMSRRRPEVLGFFSTNLQRLMSSAEESCRNLAFSLALRAHALSLLRGLSQLRAERKFLDVTLEAAGGRDFPAHRAVLAAASPYFRAMFAGQLRESRAERVRLHGVPPDMLQLLLDFSYTGRVAVSGDNAEPLLRAADLLQFPAVKEACGAFLQQQLDLANCLDMQDFAEAFSCSGLASAAQRFILRHVGELGAEQLERLPLARLLRYLRDDGLCVPKEEAAYQLALRWVRADPPRRAPHWPQLLEAVRLPFVRRFYLLAHVEAEPLVARCPPCLRLLREARDFQAARYDRHDRGPCPRMRPRPSTGLAEILVLVGGCDQDCDELVTVDCYNPQTGQWRYLAEFPDHLGGGYSIVALGNDIYVTGGSDGSRLYDCVWRYNSSVNEWTEVAPMLKAREYHSSSVLDGLLYVVAADSTERYDHATDSWEALQPMTYPMDNCSTTACRGRLYAIGSLAGKETMVIQCYDPDTDLWSLVNCGQLPPWSFAPKTVTLNGLMYFVRDDSAEVDVYNPTKDEWDKIPSMNQVHVGGSLAVLGGKLYVSGGYDNTFELSDVVEAYDPETRAWSVVGRLPEPTFWHGSVSIFRQFMPQTPAGGRGFELNSGSNDVDAGYHRLPQNPEELH